MAIQKKYLKTKPICKVTFRISPEMVDDARMAHVVGEFNAWSLAAHPMKKLKNGSFTTTIDLFQGREYQFRYLLDHGIWQNDPGADKFVPTPYGDSENSVLIT